MAIAVIYFTSIFGRRICERLGSKSSSSSLVVSKDVENGSLCIATAVHIVVMSSIRQEMMSAGWMSFMSFVACLSE